MKRLAVLLVVLLTLSQSHTAYSYGIDVCGDDLFTAKVYDALHNIEQKGWLSYVSHRIERIQQGYGDEDGHVGWVTVRRYEWGQVMGTATLRVDTGDSLYISLALVHEAAHVADYVQRGVPFDYQSELNADLITQAFAEELGVLWTVRQPIPLN